MVAISCSFICCPSMLYLESTNEKSFLQIGLFCRRQLLRIFIQWEDHEVIRLLQELKEMDRVG